MANDRHPVHTEKRRSTILGIIEKAGHRIQRGMLPGPIEFGLDQPQDEVSYRFVELQQDVSGETIADQDVARPFEDLATLDVADEVEPRVGSEQPVGLLGQLVALLGLFPDIEKADSGRLQPQHVGHVDPTEVGELNEVPRLAVDVGAGVEQQDWCSAGRKERSDRRAFNARERP